MNFHIIFLLLLIILNRFGITSASDYHFKLIGIYSVCDEQNKNSQQNHTQQSMDAEMYNKVIRAVATDFARYFKGYYHKMRLKPSIALSYVPYEVCDSYGKLSQVALEILLDPKYEIFNPDKELNDTSVLFIYSHLPARMSRYVFDLFSFTSIPVHLFELVKRTDATLYSSKFEEWTQNLIEFTEKLHWEDLFLVSITTDDDIFPYHTYYKYAIDAFVKHRKCIQLHKVAPHKVYYQNYFNTTWLKVHPKPAVVLFARGTIQASALHYLTDLHEQRGVPIMTQDVQFGKYTGGSRKPSYYFDTYSRLRTEYKQYKYGMFYQRQYPFVVITRNTTSKIARLQPYMILELGVILTQLYSMFLSFLYLPRITPSDHLKFIDLLRNDAKKSLGIFLPSKQINSAKLSSGMMYSDIDEFFRDRLNRTIKSLGTECPQPNCRPGRYKVYGEITGGYGYRCDLCPINHYKSTVGSGGCIRCQGQLSIDNGFRTKCIDPYKNIYPNAWEIVLFKLLVGLNGVGFFVAITTTALFTRKRKTPVVATSDFAISMFHLFVIVVIFMASLLLQIHSPSMTTCNLRITVISTCFVLNVSIVFIKSQKLLKAFLSKVLITEREARNTKSQQVFFVITSVVIANAVFAIVINAKSPISSYLNEANMKRVYFCDTSLHVNGIVGFVMTVQFGCFVQAFRGRNLPSIMNDGMSLVYASFTSLIMFIVMYIIVPFQKHSTKEIYQVITVNFSTFITLLLMYTQKAIRMVLHPEKNTKQYFQQKRLMEIRQDVVELTAMR